MDVDNMINAAFDTHHIRECNDYAKECEKVAKQVSCPHCGTVWEDQLAMLTCPCSDEGWIR